MDEDEDTSEGVGQLPEARSEATTPCEDKSKSPGQESTAAEADFGDAGGVISLGSNSKTLVSKASTSSLSNAQQEDGSPLKEDVEEEGNNEEEIVQSPADATKDELK
ncbi:hypothetical protein BGZ67_004393 [Mortierella alpina]|nr:hypothetical protein BGZ67_004393 [Mortierella alpina]